MINTLERRKLAQWQTVFTVNQRAPEFKLLLLMKKAGHITLAFVTAGQEDPGSSHATLAESV